MPKPTCTKPDCTKPVQARGFCMTHYAYARTHGEIEVQARKNPRHSLSEVDKEARQAVCSVCGPVKVRVRMNSGRERVECMTIRNLHRGDDNRTYTPEQIRAKQLRRYRVTQEWFDQTLAAQGGGCAICGNVSHNGRNWHVDHDHRCCPGPTQSCGKCIRGILCAQCNTGLGCARDDMGILVKMIDYLHNSRTAA